MELVKIKGQNDNSNLGWSVSELNSIALDPRFRPIQSEIVLSIVIPTSKRKKEEKQEMDWV